jgi:hypothetical protein
MQYVLTQTEYDQLRNESRDTEDRLNVLIQELCTKVCDNLPVKFWDNAKAEIWSCIRTPNNHGYCDECPVEEECPYPHKEFSK